jgi:ABC-type transport system substrate-binding protein
MDEGRTSYDVARRKAAYDRLQLLILESVPQIWFFTPDMIDFTQSYVRGFKQHPTTVFWGYDEVWLDR